MTITWSELLLAPFILLLHLTLHLCLKLVAICITILAAVALTIGFGISLIGKYYDYRSRS